jgi:hypothetical protein
VLRLSTATLQHAQSQHRHKKRRQLGIQTLHNKQRRLSVRECKHAWTSEH